MKRKVIQIAESTQLVSLPRKLAKSNNIARGDELEVTMEGNRLIVSTEKQPTKEKKTLVAEDYPNLICHVVSALYRIGYDEIEIEYQDPSLLAPLTSVLNEFFPGYEILSQSEKRMLIKDISTDIDSEFDNVLRRLFMVSISIAENLEGCMRNFNETRVLNTLSMEKTNNRFANFCMRILIKNGAKEANKTAFYVLFVWELEKVVDELKYIAQYMLRPEMKNVKLSPKLLSYYHGYVEMFKMLYDVFYKFDAEKVNWIQLKRKEIITEGIKLLEDAPKKERKIVHNIVVSAQKLANMTGSYLGITL
jgi:hypothetical protein